MRDTGDFGTAGARDGGWSTPTPTGAPTVAGEGEPTWSQSAMAPLAAAGLASGTAGPSDSKGSATEPHLSYSGATSSPLVAGTGGTRAPRQTTDNHEDHVTAEMRVTLVSASDDSPEAFDAKVRKVHEGVVRAKMVFHLRRTSGVTMDADGAAYVGLPHYNLDVSIVSLGSRENGDFMEAEAQLRVAISDHQGKMLSFVSGGAKVQVSLRGFAVAYLPRLRRDALESATHGLVGRLVAQLRHHSR